VKKHIHFILLFILVVALDQATKKMALNALYPGGSVPIASFLGIDFFWTLTANKGAAWGVLTSLPSLLCLLRLAFIILLIGIYFLSTLSSLARTALVLIIAGACSNVWDTFYWGYVVDMIHVRFWQWDYPVFNIADICICLGAAILLSSSYSSNR